jgi:hypothetical protein
VVWTLARENLLESSYNLLEAANEVGTLHICRRYDGVIHLMFWRPWSYLWTAFGSSCPLIICTWR